MLEININKICGWIGALGFTAFLFLSAGGVAKFINPIALTGLFISSLILSFWCVEEKLSSTLKDIQSQEAFLRDTTANFFRRNTFIEMDKDKR